MTMAPLLSLTDAATVTVALSPIRAPYRARTQAAPCFAGVSLRCRRTRPLTAAAAAFHGECFVVGDNIDTDQIIPAEHGVLVSTKPDEYRKLGSFALSGLPTAANPIPFVVPGEESSRYVVIIGGANFGCGSSREHAPIALGAAGARAVVAEGYARIFFRNSVATGELYPLEFADSGASKECKTGDVVTVDLDSSVLINHTSGKQYKLKPFGDAGPVIEAGGIFAYARKTGMIASKSA
jgi:3-isopropylmalate/(R)-2-methylmalate dehydratase small subunit